MAEPICGNHEDVFGAASEVAAKDIKFASLKAKHVCCALFP